MKKVFKVLIFLFIFVVINVKAEPVNTNFLDDNLYACIIDSYNTLKEKNNDYAYSILPEEYLEITNLDCSKYSGKIDNLTGLNKLTSLTSINLSGNTFLGATLKLNEGETKPLVSNILLPSTLKITDIVYEVKDENIVSVNSGNITGLKDGSTTVIMTGKIGSNEIKESYLVSVVGITPKSSNANLSSLSFSTGELSFKSDTKKYTTIVSNVTKSVVIKATLEDSKASFVTSFGPRTINLKEGTNTVYVKVKAEDGNVNSYAISIIRSDGNDSSNSLVNIELETGKIDFNPDVTIYSLTVEYDVEELKLKAIPESTLSKVKVSDTKLEVGENKITIVVTSENKIEKTYELIVTREEYESKKNYLEQLIVENYNIDFNKTKEEYTLNIKDEKKLTISANTSNITSSVSIIGNNNLKNNSVISIKVTDEDDVVREYKITVKKLFIYDLSYKGILLISEFLIIFILLLMLIFKPKKKKKIKNIGPKIQNKVCKKCGTINNPASKICYVCGKEL